MSNIREDAVNTIGRSHVLPEEVTSQNEGVELYEDALSPDMDEKDFGVYVDSQIRRANEYWNKLNVKDRRETNVKYWIGDQVDASGLREGEEKGVENAIFRNIETFIPIATSRTPEVSVALSYKNETTRKFALDVKRGLEGQWDVSQSMQRLLGRGIRNHNMQFLGVFKCGRDAETGERWTKEIIASNLVVSKNGDFVAETIDDQTLGDLLKKFPEKENEIKKEFGISAGIKQLGRKLLDSPVTYIEAWTNELVGWKYKTLTLGLEKNPHYDYVGEEFEVPGKPGQDELGNPVPKTKSYKVSYNHFKSPKHPYIFLTYWNRGIHIIDDTTIIEQGIGPQDWINKRKRQIGANADSTNGHWVTSGDFISQEEFDKIDGSIDMKVWLENGNPGEGLVKVTGNPLPDYIYNDLIDSRAALDNIMGTHSTTRGEKSGNPTASQDIMQKDQDYGRVDGYVRDGIEKFAQDWYEYQYQMMLVYDKEETYLAVPEDTDVEDDNIIFSRSKVPLLTKKNEEGEEETIPIPVFIKVKQGSTLPLDEAAEAFKAKEMKDILAPIDFFKKLGEPNPRELYKNYLIHTTDPFRFFQNDQDVQEMLMQKAQREQQAAMQQVGAAGGVPVGPATPEPLPTEQEGGEGEPTATGTANAMASILQEEGIDPAEVLGE